MSIDPLATRFNPPFALDAAPVFWMANNPYNTKTENIINDLQRNSRFKNLAVAIIDLTGRTRRSDGAGWITSAGWNMYDQRFAASLVKIAALFAAFRLRNNLRLAANEVKTDVFKTIAADWKGVVETAIPDGKPDFPKFDQIFTISGSSGAWNIDFSIEYLNHMKNMIGHSNNRSASICIDRIGFQYLNGALESDGLYSREFGGLWLGGNYAGRNWMKEPRTRLTHMGATAKAVAAFLTLLEDNRLVSPEASNEMRKIMRLAGSWFAEGLAKAHPKRPIVDIYAKVGLMGTLHDCAVIERAAPGKQIRYAAVVLGASSAQTIRDLAVKLDDYILASN